MNSHMPVPFPQKNRLTNRLKSRTALGMLGLLSVLLAVLLLGLPGPVWAQEDSAHEFQVQAGAYLITIIADPSLLSLGTVVYTITVVNSENGQPVSDARVTINARREGEDLVGWAAALNRPSNPGSYEATMQLDAGTTWYTSVNVSSSLGRVQVEAPPLILPEPRQTRSGSLVFLVVFLAILLGVAHLVRSSRKAIKARDGARAAASES